MEGISQRHPDICIRRAKATPARQRAYPSQIPQSGDRGRLYIGFKTRVPVELSFSIDAQFDPSTTREALIENAWNNWLVQRCGDVLAEIALRLLAATPVKGWRLVPLSSEHIGTEADRWLRGSFASSFAVMRKNVGERAAITLRDGAVPLRGIAYEEEELTGLLTEADIESLVENARALPLDVRDEGGRWRAVLDEIDVSARVGTAELRDGFVQGLFTVKPGPWWVKAARIFVENHDDDELFGAPIWLSDDHLALECQRVGETAKPLVFGGEVSNFGLRWNLLDRLHPAYARGDDGNVVIEWLNKNAAFRTSVDAETELAAFAERFSREKLRDCGRGPSRVAQSV